MWSNTSQDHAIKMLEFENEMRNITNLPIKYSIFLINGDNTDDQLNLESITNS